MAGATNAVFKKHGLNPIKVRATRPKGALTLALAKDLHASFDARHPRVTLRDQAAARAKMDLTSATVQEFGKHVVAVGKTLPMRRDGDKVFISHLYDHLKNRGEVQGMSMEAFKQRLVQANKKEALRLSRADQVESMSRSDVARSETPHLSATFHFVRID